MYGQWGVNCRRGNQCGIVAKEGPNCWILIVKLMARPQKLQRFPWMQLHSRVSTAQSSLKQELNLKINLSGMNSYSVAICSKVMDNKINLQRTLEHGTNTWYSGYASGSIFHSWQFHNTYNFFLSTARTWQFMIKTWNGGFGVCTTVSIYTLITSTSTSWKPHNTPLPSSPR